MRSTLMLSGLVAAASAASHNCSPNFDGRFEITVGGPTKRDLQKRVNCNDPNALVMILKDGVLQDSKGRIGSIVDNDQFQFDGPVQSTALSTSDFSVCDGTTLAHKNSTSWARCRSGNFYNLYDKSVADQCELVGIYVMTCDGSSSNGAPVSQIGDGQPQAPTGTLAPQPAGPAVSQIGDGQIQAPTGDAPPPPTGPTGPPVSQIGDGQIQAPTGDAPPPPTGPTGPPVSQIGDGQVQAPTGDAAPPPATPTGPTGPAVSQIADGQPQAPVAGQPTPPPAVAPSGGKPTSQLHLSTGQTLLVTSTTGSNVPPRPTASAPLPANNGIKAMPPAGIALAMAVLGALAL